MKLQVATMVTMQVFTPDWRKRGNLGLSQALPLGKSLGCDQEGSDRLLEEVPRLREQMLLLKGPFSAE